MHPCGHQIMYLAQIVAFFLTCIAHSFWLSPLGLVKHLAFTVSIVHMKHEVSRTRGRISVCCRHSDLPAGSVSDFVRICHWRNVPTCCPFTGLPGLSEVWIFLQNGYISVLTLYTSEWRQGCDTKRTDALLGFVSKCWGVQDAHVRSFRTVQTESDYGYPYGTEKLDLLHGTGKLAQFGVSDSSGWTQKMLGCQLEQTGYAIL